MYKYILHIQQSFGEMPMFAYQVLLDDDVEVDVSGHVVGTRQGPPGLREVVAHEDQHDGDQDHGKGDVGLGPILVGFKAHVLEPPACLNARQRQRTAQTDT